MGPGNGPDFASTFTTDNVENNEGNDDNVFENCGGEEEDLSDMQV